ncbi:MAG: response regulator [Deltaproteobacteria bacterium]|nr:response regulator [Deltaproteobacteria bacterium]MDZ4341775.1 response regulator [Candidatus Binatia bacterium]
MSLPLQYFQKLVESCPDIIIAVDKHGTITFYNDGARQNLGFSPDEVLGKNVLEIYPTMDEARRVMAAMRADDGDEKGRARNFETNFKTKKCDKIPVAISASIIYDEGGNEVGSIGFAKDIREIQRRDRLVTLAEVAVGLSHEINNSLEVLVNQVEMLQKYVGRVAADEDFIVESDRLESVASQVSKIRDITARIGQMAEEGEYGTREYLDGKLMTDLHVEDANNPCERAKPDERFPLSGLRILVVDDDAGICQSLKDLLEAERCCIDTASSGVFAMQSLKRQRFDAVLSDVVMPDMDGYQLYQAVKQATPELPVVLMTAFNYDKDHVIKRSCLKGLQGVIFKKPVNPAMLKQVLLQHCRPQGAVQATSASGLTPGPMQKIE